MVEWYSIICIHLYHILFAHSSVGEHLGVFHVFSAVNSAAMNIGMHESSWINAYIFLW